MSITPKILESLTLYNLIDTTDFALDDAEPQYEEQPIVEDWRDDYLREVCEKVMAMPALDGIDMHMIEALGHCALMLTRIDDLDIEVSSTERTLKRVLDDDMQDRDTGETRRLLLNGICELEERTAKLRRHARKKLCKILNSMLDCKKISHPRDP